ncbi:hypothetical protein [Paenarthrobacter nitroguajacolicus]
MTTHTCWAKRTRKTNLRNLLVQLVLESQMLKPKTWHLVGNAALGSYIPSFADKRPVRVGELRQAIRQHAPSALLPAIAVISSGLREYEFDPNWRIFSPWATAAVAKESLLWGSEYREKPVTVRSLHRIFSLFNRAENGVPKGDDLHLMMTGFLYEQAAYADTPLNDMARTLLLLRDTKIDAPEIPERDWTDVLGVELEEWLIIVFALATAARTNQGRLDPAAPRRENWQGIDTRLDSERVDVVLDQLTVDVEAFKTKTADVAPTADHLWRFSYNQLRNTPVVKFSEDSLVAP